MGVLLDGWGAGGSGGDGEGIGLDFFVDFVGHHIDLVEYRFEVVLFMVAIVISGKLPVEIVFYVFVS